MICGKDPEVGDSLVTKKWLTNDTFEAPRIRSTNHSMKLFCDPAIDQKAKHTWELGKYKYADSDAGNKKNVYR